VLLWTDLSNELSLSHLVLDEAAYLHVVSSVGTTFNVFVDNTTQISDTSTLDFSELSDVRITTETNQTHVSFGNIVYRSQLSMNKGNFDLNGIIHLFPGADDPAWHDSLFEIFDSQSIKLGRKSSVSASYV
jgi:hypothetical protein